MAFPAGRLRRSRRGGTHRGRRGGRRGQRWKESPAGSGLGGIPRPCSPPKRPDVTGIRSGPACRRFGVVADKLGAVVPRFGVVAGKLGVVVRRFGVVAGKLGVVGIADLGRRGGR
ncbi:MAG: hypothetical protein M0013_09385 [Actinomycetota bacterium]|nr:hypothetical protein [Actinomycetota bacterium]